MDSNPLFDSIRHGSRVTIGEDERTGRAVMKGPAGWVLNMGGPHGTPAIATPDNVQAVGAKKKLVKPQTLKRNCKELAAIAQRAARIGPEAGKPRFHSVGKSVLRAILAELGVEGDVRSCLGGIAVLGEVILHTDHVYVCLGVSIVGGDDPRFMYRTCKGRKDYGGGPNLWWSFRWLAEDPQRFIDCVRALSSQSAATKS